MKTILIVLTAGVAAFLIATSGVSGQPTAQQTARIAGQVVTPEGQPVPRALVRIQGRGATGPGKQTQAKVYVEMASADGRFAVESIEPGPYTMNAQLNGYTMPNVTMGATPDPREGPFTIGAGESRRDLRITMVRLGTVSGVVLDADGLSIPGARVRLVRQVFTQGRLNLASTGENAADDQGQFRLINLQPGRYYLVGIHDSRIAIGNGNEIVGLSAREANLPTFYPGVADIRGASQIEVGSAPIENLQIRLLRGRTYSIRGRIEGVPPRPGGADGPGTANVQLVPRAAGGINSNFSYSIRGDQFEFYGIPPGDYTLYARISAQAGSGMRRARTELSVTNADLENLVLRPVEGLEITGRIRLEDGTPWGTFAPAPNVPLEGRGRGDAGPARPMITLIPIEENAQQVARISPSEDGTFTSKEVFAGRYLINLPQPQRAYLKSVKFGGQDMTRKELEITSGGELELVISTKMSTVVLRRPAKLAESRQSVMVVLWPATPDRSSQNGGVVMATLPPPGVLPQGFIPTQTLPPGEYLVAAFEQVPSQDVLRVPDFLARFNGSAAKVTLKEGERTEIEPAVIPGAAAKKAFDEYP